MDEKTLVALLTRLALQLIELHDKEGKLERRPELAARLAEATWDGLVFMLRQSIASKETVVLEDVGIFRYDGERCVFVPAASLSEAEAINHKAEEAYKKLTRVVLYHLDQGTALVNVIPHDVSLTTADRGLSRGDLDDATDPAMTRLMEELFGPPPPPSLSELLNQRAQELSRVAGLLVERSSANATAATTATAAATATPATAEEAPPPAEWTAVEDFESDFMERLREASEGREEESGGESAQLGAAEDT